MSFVDITMIKIHLEYELKLVTNFRENLRNVICNGKFKIIEV